MSYKKILTGTLVLGLAVLVLGCAQLLGDTSITGTPGEVVDIPFIFTPESDMWTSAGLGLDDPLYFFMYANTASKYNRQPIPDLQGVTYSQATTITDSWGYTIPDQSTLWNTWDCNSMIFWNHPCRCGSTAFTRIGWASHPTGNSLNYEIRHHNIYAGVQCPPPVTPTPNPVEDAYVNIKTSPDLRSKIVLSYTTDKISVDRIIVGYTDTDGYNFKIPSGNFLGPGDRATVTVELLSLGGYEGHDSIIVSPGQSVDLVVNMIMPTTTSPTIPGTTITTPVIVVDGPPPTTTTESIPWSGFVLVLVALGVALIGSKILSRE